MAGARTGCRAAHFWHRWCTRTDQANDAYFDEPEVDAEIERISRLPIDEQPIEWGALDKTIMTDYFPALILGYPAAALPYGTRIGGMRVDTNSGGMPTWKDIHILQ